MDLEKLEKAVFEKEIGGSLDPFDVLVSSSVFEYDFIGVAALDTSTEGVEIRQYLNGLNGLEIRTDVPAELDVEGWNVNYTQVYEQNFSSHLDQSLPYSNIEGSIHYVDIGNESVLDRFSDDYLTEDWANIGRVDADLI